MEIVLFQFFEKGSLIVHAPLDLSIYLGMTIAILIYLPLLLGIKACAIILCL